MTSCAEFLQEGSGLNVGADGDGLVEALWFDLDPVPGVADPAVKHCNPHCKAVHVGEASVRYLWLDRAQRARRA